MRFLWLILLVFVAIFAAIFSMLNTETISLHLIVGVVSLPIATVVLFGVLVGAFLSFVLCSYSLMRLKVTNRRLRRQLAKY